MAQTDKRDIKELTADDLNRYYSEGETCDSEFFAEGRSNILLSAGAHYNKKNSKWLNRLRDNKELQNEQKLRLTNNHIHPIVRTYINNITSQSPGVTPVPNNPKERKDQKSAELNKAVWQYAKYNQDLRTKIQSFAKDFIEIGEVVCKVYWDPSAGHLVGYEQEVDEDGVPQVDAMGQPVSSERAVFSGDLLFEQIYGFNLIRPVEAKTIRDAKWLCVRKMVDLADIKGLLHEDPKKAEKVTATRDETFLVFDGSRSTYTKAENQAMLKEYYFRPSAQCPKGYFYIVCQSEILFKGELPYGIFPIVYEGFDEISTTPRHRSIIKQLRPFQAEINRASSKIAEHQVTLGDDKVILQNGSKATTGPHLPGIRTMYVTGMSPTILPGRTGDQYLEYVKAKILEMYQVANLEQEMMEKEPMADPFANLYRSIKNKKKFSMYAEKFENFLKNMCETYLKLAKEYFDENMLIPAIGRSEYINIAEFKNQEPLCFQIKIEPQSDDIETQMGKHLVLNHVLQYVGTNLQKDDIGMVLRQMPFVNHEETFSDFTLDFDTATNIILALDRGEAPQPSKNDNDVYILKKLTSRQKQADYRLLSPEIQAAYDELILFYEEAQAQKAEAIRAAQNEFIPSSGAMIKVDYYVPDPNNASRSIRATLPAESIDWLIKRLSEQGSTQQQIGSQTTASQADIARMLTQLKTQGQPQGSVLPINGTPQAFQG